MDVRRRLSDFRERGNHAQASSRGSAEHRAAVRSRARPRGRNRQRSGDGRHARPGLKQIRQAFRATGSRQDQGQPHRVGSRRQPGSATGRPSSAPAPAGTPSARPQMLTSTGKPLATGLPADPVAAARAYVAANRDLLGLTAERRRRARECSPWPRWARAPPCCSASASAACPPPSTACSPSASATAPSGYVSSSLARDAAAPAPATLTAADAERIAIADAGRADADVMRTELVAVPTADRGARAAYEVVLGADVNGAHGPGRLLHLRGRARRRRAGPRGPRRPRRRTTPSGRSSRTRRRSTTRRPTPGCAGASPPAAGCDEVVGTPASPLRWDVDPATGPSTHTTTGNNAIAVHNWFSNDPFTVGTETATPRPGPRLRLPVDQPVVRAALQPGHRSPRRSATTSTRPGPTCSRCTTGCTTGRTTSASPRRPGTCRTTTSAGAASATTPSRATPRPAASAAARPAFAARDNANQITPPDGLAPITNMYLWQPIAGSFYAPVRRRRLRHVGDRPRVRPRHHQPHDRRPERRAQLAAGHERELVGPDGDGVPLRARLRRARDRGPSRSASTSPATRSPASATTT